MCLETNNIQRMIRSMEIAAYLWAFFSGSSLTIGQFNKFLWICRRIGIFHSKFLSWFHSMCESDIKCFCVCVRVASTKFNVCAFHFHGWLACIVRPPNRTFTCTLHTDLSEICTQLKPCIVLWIGESKKIRWWVHKCTHTRKHIYTCAFIYIIDV